MPNPQTYNIRGTKVTSPYPVKLTPAETRLIFSLQKIFPPTQIFPDSYFPKPDHTTNFNSKTTNQSNSKTTSSLNPAPTKSYLVSDAALLQIDCLAIDERGIFVFESKDFVGWIYGHGERTYWTQVSAYGRNKNQFYNPIRQNSSHIAAIASIFDSKIPIYNFIVFGRDATLKVLENLPENCHICTQSSLLSTLNSIKSPRSPLSAPEIQAICSKLTSSRINPTSITRANHLSEAKSAQNYTKNARIS